MSFRFDNKVITLENYKEVFGNCSPDILDEIRLAILDDTPIGNFISCCGVDSYKLSQFRKAIRELVPIEFLKPYIPAEVLKCIRLGIRRGYDVSELLRYFNDKGIFIDLKSLEILAEFVSIGVDISSVDFTKVPKSQVDTFCKGLYMRYPMWLLVSNTPISDSRLNLLMRGMALGIDIHPFLNDAWHDDIIILLFSKVNNCDINAFLGKITPMFDKEKIDILLSLAVKNLSYDILCLRDSDGYPLFNTYQMDVLSTAIKEGVLTNEMLNPNMSDTEMYRLLEFELLKHNRVLSVSLRKKS